MAEAAHRNIFFPGSAGRIEAVYWKTAVPAPPIAAVICHPHPLFGGTLHNKVVYQVARTFDRLSVPALRFNFRGAGMSEGTHDRGLGEQEDVRAAIDFMAGEYPGVPIAVAGFSFGCWVGLRVGCADARVTELVGLGAPVGDSDFGYLAKCDKPRLMIQGEHDQFGSPEKVKELVRSFPAKMQKETRVIVVPDGDHFFTGHLAKVDEALTAWLVERHSELAHA
jgi:alpha/beta superfamily hydrolase